MTIIDHRPPASADETPGDWGITVLCDERLLSLVDPVLASRPIPHDDHCVPEVVAVYDRAVLEDVPPQDLAAAGAWWHELGPADDPIAWDEAAIREEGGVWGYLDARHGLTNRLNRARGLHTLAAARGVTPIQLADWIAAHAPEGS